MNKYYSNGEVITLKKDELSDDNTSFFLELNESEVMRLPICGPISRRILVTSQVGNSEQTRELFVQRNDAFSTNLYGLLRSIKEMEITEIRYTVGIDGLVKVLLDEEGKLLGEFFCKSENSMKEFKHKMQIS